MQHKALSDPALSQVVDAHVVAVAVLSAVQPAAHVMVLHAALAGHAPSAGWQTYVPWVQVPVPVAAAVIDCVRVPHAEVQSVAVTAAPRMQSAFGSLQHNALSDPALLQMVDAHKVAVSALSAVQPFAHVMSVHVWGQESPSPTCT